MYLFIHAGASAIKRYRGNSDWLYPRYIDNYFASVSCNGSEQNLLQCTQDDASDYNYCDFYFGAVGVICYGRFFWYKDYRHVPHMQWHGHGIESHINVFAHLNLKVRIIFLVISALAKVHGEYSEISVKILLAVAVLEVTCTS